MRSCFDSWDTVQNFKQHAVVCSCLSQSWATSTHFYEQQCLCVSHFLVCCLCPKMLLASILKYNIFCFCIVFNWIYVKKDEQAITFYVLCSVQTFCVGRNHIANHINKYKCIYVQENKARGLIPSGLLCSMDKRSSEDMPGAMMFGCTTTTLKGSPPGNPVFWSQLPSESSSSLGKPFSEAPPPKGPSGDSTLMCMGGDCSYSSPPSS